MRWFSSKKSTEIINKPEEMSPIESVTHLCAAIQISDGQVDYEEKESWSKMVKNLFPDHSDERAERFLNQAFIVLNKKNKTEKIIYIKNILKRIKILLDNEQLKQLCLDVSKLIESDGIVMTSEIEIADLIKLELGISIILNKDL
tara:strand:- start:776 stop:1210 length:435 start_codon:yes stop_codon:yes gene_type:complete